MNNHFTGSGELVGDGVVLDPCVDERPADDDAFGVIASIKAACCSIIQ